MPLISYFSSFPGINNFSSDVATRLRCGGVFGPSDPRFHQKKIYGFAHWTIAIYGPRCCFHD